MIDGFLAIGTVKNNQVDLPRALAEHRPEAGKQGSLVIKMHRHRQMAVVSWQDFDMLSLLSIKKDAWVSHLNVLQRKRGQRHQMVVPSIPIYREYGDFMRGLDVTDHLRSLYSIQMRGHKWWMKIFSFLFDQSIVNLDILTKSPIVHLA
jgi:hypothetical protein